MVDNIIPPLENNTGFVTTDPTVCTVYDRTEAQLQEFLIFCVCVAGKNARTIQKALQRFWAEVSTEMPCSGTPFTLVNRWVALFNSTRVGPFALADKLRSCGIGCHRLKAKCILSLAKAKGLDLKTCTTEDLEKFCGIGPKTSRFFILHSRKDAKVACLDVHILRYMREKRKMRGIPLQTPQSRKRYQEVEAKFLRLVPKGKTPAEFDLQLWLQATK